jgi:hypothetical protein
MGKLFESLYIAKYIIRVGLKIVSRKLQILRGISSLGAVSQRRHKLSSHYRLSNLMPSSRTCRVHSSIAIATGHLDIPLPCSFLFTNVLSCVLSLFSGRMMLYFR